MGCALLVHWLLCFASSSVKCMTGWNSQELVGTAACGACHADDFPAVQLVNFLTDSARQARTPSRFASGVASGSGLCGGSRAPGTLRRKPKMFTDTANGFTISLVTFKSTALVYVLWPSGVLGAIQKRELSILIAASVRPTIATPRPRAPASPRWELGTGE